MSHFHTVVLLAKDKVAAELGLALEGLTIPVLDAETGAIEEMIRPVLAPYDETIEAAPYDTECYCVGGEAKKAAFQAAETVHGSIDSFRSRYWEMPESDRPDWDEFIAAFTATEKEAERRHPLYGKPAADCEECRGSGTRVTTYNPSAKWDWYTIGGRWNGEVAGTYEPDKDPANYETCEICGGTGKRLPPPQTGPGTQDCNGCDGTGRRRMFSDAVRAGNIAPVEVFLRRVEAKEAGAFAVVTPDGKWFDWGNMGWWGIVTNEKPDEQWREQLLHLLRKHPDTIAVGVDCHI